MNRTAIALAAITLTAGMAMSHEASAIQRFNLTNGAGSCQGALPSFEGNLRKRPTAISNEGTANAFVSCSIAQDFFGNSADVYGIIVNNNGTAIASVSCTFVAGIKYNGEIAPTLITKTFDVPAGGASEIQWSAADNAGVALPTSGNWSCNLPIRTEVGATYIVVDDGSAAEAPPT